MTCGVLESGSVVTELAFYRYTLGFSFTLICEIVAYTSIIVHIHFLYVINIIIIDAIRLVIRI